MEEQPEEEVEEQYKPRQLTPAPTFRQRFRLFLKECWRVLRVTKKPDKEEFKTIVKVSGIGILIIGLIGFLVHLLRELLF